MKHLYLSLVALFSAWVSFGQSAPRWHAADTKSVVPDQPLLKPDHYRVFTTDKAELKTALWAAAPTQEQGVVILLPSPDGTLRPYKIWQNDVMHPDLAARYPELRTFSGQDLERPGVVLKAEYSPEGFHAYVFNGKNTFVIDPYSRSNDGRFLVYYRRDFHLPAGLESHCELAAGPDEEAALLLGGEMPPLSKLYGNNRRTYRLALACTGEYAQAATSLAAPTKAQVLAKMITSVNRVSGVYEQEVAVSFQLIPNTDTLIFLDGTTDPYSNGSGSTMLGENQTTITQRIGSSNYDIGHVFSTGGGGIAQLGCVCQNNSKARGVTGRPDPVGDPFDIDYVAHEIGHQFGGSHTFNANTGSCSGNGSSTSAYEPGSGTTIMAYAGICSTNNTQPNSDPYFHARSLDQISNFIVSGSGGSCGNAVATGNMPPAMPSFGATYSIPYLTPFELTAPQATDNTTSTELTYCWEQYNLGQFMANFSATRWAGPIFRSFLPDTSRTRVFPQPSRLVRNVYSYLGEKLPDTARELRFFVTVRDVFNGYGSWNWTNGDTTRLNVIETPDTFKVTSFNTAGPDWAGGYDQTVTWKVAGTDQAPISCATVDIYLSLDSGYTWPYLLLAGAPNNGSAIVTIPNIPTDKARIKVKASNNVFFEINDRVQRISFTQAGVKPGLAADQLSVFPVPARDFLQVKAPAGAAFNGRVVDGVGRLVWTGTVSDATSIAVAGWMPGLYFLHLADKNDGSRIARPFVVE
jgi:hypothetical protein